jgi:hypothetical protein
VNLASRSRMKNLNCPTLERLEWRRCGPAPTRPSALGSG